MEYFYLYIFILVSFVCLVSYYNTYMNTHVEAFASKPQTFILLGDSILKNDAYVSDGKSVDDLLKERTNGASVCLAADHSKIVDIYSQLERLPPEINNNSTTIFLSAGGNDILTYYVDQGNTATDTSILGPMFAAYKKLVKHIHTILPKAKLVLLDIYYPENLSYTQYHRVLKEWNGLVYKYASKNDYSVLKISKVLTKLEDFSFGIEPSATGSRKIVETIISSY
jgi:hypothetical protein